jgi:bacterioferritin-associated ferredoxin
VYVCSCFGITEQQVRQHAADGRCTPRQIASASKAGTDCGSCVKRIQNLLGRGAGCATRTKVEPADAPPVTLVRAEAEPEPAAARAEAPAVRPRVPGVRAA